MDLLAEGLWEELLDDEQPDITVMDWYAPTLGSPSQGLTQPPLWSELLTKTLLVLQALALPTSPAPSL